MKNDQGTTSKPGLAMSNTEAKASAQKNFDAGQSGKCEADTKRDIDPAARVSNMPRGNDNPANTSGSVRGGKC